MSADARRARRSKIGQSLLVTPAPGGAGAGAADPIEAWWHTPRTDGAQHLYFAAPPDAANTDTTPTEIAAETVAFRRGPGAGFEPSRLAMALGIFVAVCLAVLSGRFIDSPYLSRVMVVALGLFATAVIAGRLQWRHPGEPWLRRYLLLGLAAKLVASVLRYRTLSDTYANVGDAPIYDKFGRRFVAFWTGEGPEPFLVDLRKTNFVRWFTGVAYYLFGTDIIAGFMVFGLIAFVGAYLWYRATVEAVPFLDARLYLLIVMFAPSILFWPSSIGKESLMQFGIGGTALGAAHILNGRLIRGIVVAVPGAWLMWVVRPHLLGLITFATTVAYLLGRRRRPSSGQGTSVWKPVGLAVLMLLAVLAIGQGAQSLGIESLSLESINAELESTSVSTGQGGSSFDPGDTSITPLSLPRGIVTVLIRPFPWEVDSAVQVLASLEGVALVVFMVMRRRSLLLSIRRLRERPFLIYCWTLAVLYSLTFQAFANFGLLVRQRSLVLPALYVLLCLDANRSDVTQVEPVGPVSAVTEGPFSVPYGGR